MKIVHGWAFPDADAFMSREMAADGTYQADHLDAALRHVTDFRCALDGGAHVGTWSRLMAARFAEVVAVEASPDTLEALRWNMAKHDCGGVRIVHVALGATAGTVRMALDDANAARANTGARFAIDGGDIPRFTIDGLGLESLGFLKLDIEGSEPAALEGAVETLRRCRPIVLYEDKGLCRTHFGRDRTSCETILSSCGYRRLQRIGCDEIWGPR